MEGEDAGWVRFEYNGDGYTDDDDETDGFYDVGDEMAVGQMATTFSTIQVGLPHGKNLEQTKSAPAPEAGPAGWFGRRATNTFRLDRVPVSATMPNA